MNQIQFEGVSKAYGDVKALDNVSLTLEGTKIIGLLGRNGAGKTTLLNALTGRIFPDSGQIRVGGLRATENDKAQSLMYMMSEQNTYPENMRIKDVFKWTNTFYQGKMDMAYADKLCGMFGLDTKKRVKQLSTGYGSIFKLVVALSLDVPYVLLDEPVLGLDANHREMLYRILMETYAERPRMIIISTHLIEEISSLIEEVVIIKKGRILQQTACEDLLASTYVVSGPLDLVNQYIAGREVLGQDTLGGLKSAYIVGQADLSAPHDNLEFAKPDLQRVFVQMTNE